MEPAFTLGALRWTRRAGLPAAWPSIVAALALAQGGCQATPGGAEDDGGPRREVDSAPRDSAPRDSAVADEPRDRGDACSPDVGCDSEEDAGDGGREDGSAADSDPGDGGGEEPVPCPGDCVYVRAGASGDGSSWAAALPDLPRDLRRGAVYFLAVGRYRSHNFGDAEDGESTITVRKATARDHGGGEGWDPSYAEGRATMGPLTFEAPRYEIDGGPGLGIVVRGEVFGAGSAVVRVDDGGDHVTLRRLELDGAFAVDDRGRHSDGACFGIRHSRADHLTVDGCDIHDAADDGAQIYSASYVWFHDTVIHHLHGAGTDASIEGPCENGHSDGFEFSRVSHSVFERNFVHHVVQTSTMFFSNVDFETNFCEDLLLQNNIFYAPDTGLIAYLQRARGLRVYNNVFWGQRSGRYGGLAIGNNLTDLRMFNNVILSLNLSHMGATFDPAEHHLDHNLIGADLGQLPLGPHDVVAPDPSFERIPDLDGDMVPDPTTRDFALRAGSPAVDAGRAADGDDPIPEADILGTPRSGRPDIGAFER